MITSKELQYVNNRAREIPMPGKEYCTKVMEEMKSCYEIYNDLYKNKEYNFIFSNGEEIGFEILSKNLCHMLGVDYNNIKSDFFESFRKRVLGTDATDFTSYELIELILENSDKVVESDNCINIRAKAIIYYKSGIKCQIIKKLSDFDKFNFAAINYNPGDEKYDYDSQKTLFVPSNEAVCPYFMIGIKKEDSIQKQETLDGDNENQYNQDISIPKYFVTSLFAPLDPVKFFDGQEVIIPTQILISDNDILTRLNATPSEKLQLLTMYKNIINYYRLTPNINIFGDYEATLKEQADSKKLTKILR